MFFVISGYLISGLILAEVKADNFSLSRFYERRVRRIFPALAAVMLATLILACVYFLPFEMKNFAKSLLAATFCVSNMYFWGKSGYFEALATEKPLLHTWSLAVEEQFYFFFPLLLLLTRHVFRRKLEIVVVVILLFSLVVGILGAYYRPAAAFYLAPTRAWELLLGTLVALEILPEVTSSVLRNVVTLAGIGLIGASIVGFSANTLYPGIASLVPCIGAAAIIWAGRAGGSLVATVLATRPMTFIGLISYSLYLWHWPIIVFHRMGLIPADGYPAWVEKTGIIGLSIVVSALSWKYIETPFRDKQVSTRVLYRFALSGAALLVLAGVGMLATNGFSARFSLQVAQVASFLEYDPRPVSRAGTCFIEANYTHGNIDTSDCLRWVATKKNYLLMGDSHAAHLWYGLAREFPDLNILQATAAGCKPTIDHAYHEDHRHCRPLMDYVDYDFLAAHKVDTIMIEAIWREEDLPLVPRMLDFAKQHANSVVLFGPMVQYDAALPRLLAVSLMRDDPAYPYHHRLDFLAQLDDKMAEIAREHNVKYVSFFKMLCAPNTCETILGDGAPMLYDYGHLTTEGSMRVATYIRDHGILP